MPLTRKPSYIILIRIKLFKLRFLARWLKDTRGLPFSTPRVPRGVTYSSEHLLAVVFLSGINVVVDKCEAGSSATTELGLKTEDGNGLLLALEGLGKLDLDVFLGDVGKLGVDELNDLRELEAKRYLRIAFSASGGSSRIYERKG